MTHENQESTIHNNMQASTSTEIEDVIHSIDLLHGECNAGCSLSSYEVENLIKTFTTFKDQCVREERERMQTMPNSVTIRIIANDATDQEAIQRVVTLKSVGQSSGTALKLIIEDAIRALVESKVIQRAINSKDV